MSVRTRRSATATRSRPLEEPGNTANPRQDKAGTVTDTGAEEEAVSSYYRTPSTIHRQADTTCDDKPGSTPRRSERQPTLVYNSLPS